MSIGENAVFLAAAGDKGTSSSRAGIGFATGSSIDTSSGKGAINLKLDSGSTIIAATDLTLMHKTAGGSINEITVALPMDTYCLAFRPRRTMFISFPQVRNILQPWMAKQLKRRLN